MDGDQVKATLNEFSIFDQPIVEHGFMPYNRDYRVVVDIAGQRSPGGPVQILERYTLLFRGCVAADYETKVTELDLNDVFVDYERWKAAGEPLGFVWGVNWADGYPGPTYLA